MFTPKMAKALYQNVAYYNGQIKFNTDLEDAAFMSPDG